MTPSRRSNSVFARARSLMIRVMSTCCTVVSCAETCSDSVIRWAITCRSRGIFTVEPGFGPSAAGVGTVLGLRGVSAPAAAGCGSGVGSGSGSSACSAAASTSCLRIRPPTPVPLTVARSTPCSDASLRTNGVTYGAPVAPPLCGGRPRPQVGVRLAVGRGALGGGFRRLRLRLGLLLVGLVRPGCFLGVGVSPVGGVALGGRSGSAVLRFGLGVLLRTCPRSRAGVVRPRRRPTGRLSPMTASLPPTSMVASSSAMISRSVPATGDGISVSTLSVDTSSSGSSTSTWSPICFSHRHQRKDRQQCRRRQLAKHQAEHVGLKVERLAEIALQHLE